jgi:hypothetical protein
MSLPRKIQRIKERRDREEKILAVIETIIWLIAGILLLIALSGCASLKPSWQGLYIGQEIVEPITSYPWASRPDTEATAIIGIGKAGAVEFGAWGNLQDHGYRIAIERRVW